MGMRFAEQSALAEVFSPMNRLEIDGKEPLIAEYEGKAILDIALWEAGPKARLSGKAAVVEWTYSLALSIVR